MDCSFLWLQNPQSNKNNLPSADHGRDVSFDWPEYQAVLQELHDSHNVAMIEKARGNAGVIRKGGEVSCRNGRWSQVLLAGSLICGFHGLLFFKK